MLNQLTDSLNFQAQALSLRSERQRLLASNIANADTPGYVAREMNFSAALQQATSAQSSANTLATTQSGHIASAASELSDSQLLYAANSQTSLDSNTVDMDRERASFADNSVKYEATLRFINSSISDVMNAMKSSTGT